MKDIVDEAVEDINSKLKRNGPIAINENEIIAFRQLDKG